MAPFQTKILINKTDRRASKHKEGAHVLTCQIVIRSRFFFLFVLNVSSA